MLAGGSPSTEPKLPWDRAEVAVRIDQRMPQREVLRHPHERVVDRRVAVRVVLRHHPADDVGGFPVRTVGADPLLVHRPQDPAVDGLQAVANLGQRAAHDDRHGVVEVRPLDLVLELDRLDPPREQPFLCHALSPRWAQLA